jgi:hypothetical protein
LENYKKENQEKRFKVVNDPELESLDIVAFKGKRIPKQDVIAQAEVNEYVEQIVQVKTRDGKRVDTSDKNLYDCQFVRKEGPGDLVAISQNIAQEPQLLNPALMNKLNGKISEKYLESIAPELMEMSKEDYHKCREDIASLVHDVWVEENKSWAPEEQKVPYSQLPEFEKEKDRRVADALMDTVQEVKTIEKLKEIEIESKFEPLSKHDSESVKRASEWIKQINVAGKVLSKSPWFLEASKTLDKVRESMSREVYNIAYKEFESSLLGGTSKALEKSKSRVKAVDYEPGMGM